MNLYKTRESEDHERLFQFPHDRSAMNDEHKTKAVWVAPTFISHFSRKLWSDYRWPPFHDTPKTCAKRIQKAKNEGIIFRNSTSSRKFFQRHFRHVSREYDIKWRILGRLTLYQNRKKSRRRRSRNNVIPFLFYHIIEERRWYKRWVGIRGQEGGGK